MKQLEPPSAETLKSLKKAADFLAFYKKLPENRWTKNQFRTKAGTRACALGHLGYGCGNAGAPLLMNAARRLNGIVGAVVEETSIASINDANEGFEKFQKYGSTPRARVLTFLNRAVAAGL